MRLTWIGIVDEIGVNTWLDVTLYIAPDEFQGQPRSPEVTYLGWTYNDKYPIGICLVGFPEVLNLNLWFIVPKNVSKPLLPHPLRQSSSFDQFEFCPLRRWQPARVMPLYLGAPRMLNIATGCNNNTLSCLELNREHAGEGFRSLRHIRTPLWACKSKKCHGSRKFDLWPNLTRSNVDIGLKTICAIARFRRDASIFFSVKLYDHQGPIARGVVPPPPPDRPRYEKCPDRARVNSHEFGNDAAAPQARNFAFWNHRTNKQWSNLIDNVSLFHFTWRCFTF